MSAGRKYTGILTLHNCHFDRSTIPIVRSGEIPIPPSVFARSPRRSNPEPPSLRGVRDACPSISGSNPGCTTLRLCEALRSNQGSFEKKYQISRVFSLSRPGAKHPGPPQDFLGRKSFAEMEGKNRKDLSFSRSCLGRIINFHNFREKIWKFHYEQEFSDSARKSYKKRTAGFPAVFEKEYLYSKRNFPSLKR